MSERDGGRLEEWWDTASLGRSMGSVMRGFAPTSEIGSWVLMIKMSWMNLMIMMITMITMIMMIMMIMIMMIMMITTITTIVKSWFVWPNFGRLLWFL